MTEQREVRIVNPMGMHARPAAEFVRIASSFSAKVTVKKEDLAVDGKSIMGVLMLAAEHGSTLQITAEGEDAFAAVEALVDLIGRGFDE